MTWSFGEVLPPAYSNGGGDAVDLAVASLT
jgi:hypothetical protein